MAYEESITVVPEVTPGQVEINAVLKATPYSLGWWTSQTVNEIPEQAVGWLVAQGWEVTDITYDNRRNPPIPSYELQRDSLQNWNILQSLLEEWVTSYNTALANNTVRYNDIIGGWNAIIASTHDYLETQTNEQNNFSENYLADNDTYMDAVDDEINDLELGYQSHSFTANSFYDGLGTTELARINEEFAASLATQLQQLVDRGLYSAGVAADITERNTRDRDEQIQLLNDRLNREKSENQHKLYDQEITMRSRVISDRINVANNRQQALSNVYSQNLALMQYQLGTRNEQFVGLWGFVERRDDVYPTFENLVQLSTGLADAGGGWVAP